MRRAFTLFVVVVLAAPSCAAEVVDDPFLAEGSGELEAEAVFSTLCDFSHQRSDDPIVFPRLPGASHLHQFGGNRSTDAFSTYMSMRAAQTSCPLSSDTAGYWFPALIKPDGTPARVLDVNAYYRNAPEVGPLRAYPANLRIIAGAPTTTTGTQKLGFSCFDNDAYVASPPNCPSTSRGVKAHIIFPECWDGRSIDSADHRSHMTYASSAHGCPMTHPIRVPRLALHVTWDVNNAASGGYRLSSDRVGDGRGHTLHADFWNTWNQTQLERFVNRCLVQRLDVPESQNDPGCKDLQD